MSRKDTLKLKNPVQVIYTPEAENFFIKDCYSPNGFPLNDLQVLELKKNYLQLRQILQITLPQKVGVITTVQTLKETAKENFKNRKDEDLVKTPSTYTPLDILESLLFLGKTKLKDDLDVEYVYRNVCSILGGKLGASAVTLDEYAPKVYRAHLLLLSNDPNKKYFLRMLRGGIKKAREKGRLESEINQIIEMHNFSKEHLRIPDFRRINGIKTYFANRFLANKVSRDFPLHWYPSKRSLSQILTVSLEDRIEKGRSNKIEERINLMLKMGEREHFNEKEQGWIDELKKDMFGITTDKSFTAIEDFLEELPEPKTVITDTYIVDEFPQLKGKINTKEFILQPN